MDANAIQIDLRLPDDDEAASAMIKAAERLFPGNPLGIFILNRLVLETLPYPHRDDDGWA